MSDDPNELQRQLEQATARSAPSGESLDAQTASLREAWLALGHLLEAAQPAADQGRAAGGGWRVTGGQDAIAHHPPRTTHHLTWLVLAAGGLAATLLAAVTIAWMMRGGGTQVAGGGTQVTGGENADPRHAPAATGQPSSQTDLAWDDTLDKQIVLAGEAVLSVQEDWSVLADAANSVHYGIRQMEKDVQGSPL